MGAPRSRFQSHHRAAGHAGAVGELLLREGSVLTPSTDAERRCVLWDRTHNRFGAEVRHAGATPGQVLRKSPMEVFIAASTTSARSHRSWSM